MVIIKRVYDQPEKKDGYRIFIDRLWPRGMRKDALHYDIWLKDIAPSSSLRTWFGHKPERFAEFTKRYKAELKENVALNELKQLCKGHKNICLLIAAKDAAHNHALVVKEILK